MSIMSEEYEAWRRRMLRPRYTREECRESRRYRTEKRRLNSGKAPISSQNPNNSENLTENLEGNKFVPPTMSTNYVPESIPAYGVMSVAGRSREMEDAISIHTELCWPEINGRRPVHFFGMFDGHGGSHVSTLCRDRMHVLMMQELKSVVGDAAGEEGWQAAIKRCFERMDELALNLVDIATVGTTAVVALLTKDYIFVANCGDSRAVLCRAGRAIPLSRDHKPDRQDERERITASGGQVYHSDTARVIGILPTSRAIGDKFLKPGIISSVPEISITKREAEDECLILASDGLWDVLSNELACQISHKCLTEIQADDNPAAATATLLTRLALGRKSLHNISVIVVDFIN